MINKFVSIRKLREIRRSKDYNRLIENFLSLSALQWLNYLLPLITFPYIVRVLGTEKFGLLAFATATVTYFQIITDYGFNLSATREIAINRDRKRVIQEIFNSVLAIKVILIFVSIIFLAFIIFIFPKFRKDWYIYCLSFLSVIGNTLFPIWFFQGMERMKYIAILNIFSKFISTIFIFVLVKHQADYWKIPLINGVGSIAVSLWSIYLVRKNFGITLYPVGLNKIVLHLKNGWNIFLSTLSISLYTTSTPFILGLFTNDTLVGYYAAADKIIQMVKSIISPLSQSVYPYISKKASQSKELALRFVRKLLLIVALFTGLLSFLTFMFKDLIVGLVLGEQYTESVIVLAILSIHPFLIGISNILGINTMLTFGMKIAFQNIIVVASILNIILSVVLVPLYQHIGSAISVTIVEFLVTTSMLVYLQISGVKIINIGGRNV